MYLCVERIIRLNFLNKRHTSENCWIDVVDEEIFENKHFKKHFKSVILNEKGQNIT